jgi:hypothetical protein
MHRGHDTRRFVTGGTPGNWKGGGLAVMFLTLRLGGVFFIFFFFCRFLLLVSSSVLHFFSFFVYV